MKTPVGSGLAERLRHETRDLHTQAERAGIMGELLRGRIDRPAYCALLRNLHAIYEVLERILDAHAAADWVKALWQPPLRREARLAQDLDVLHGGDWRHEIAIEGAAQRYVERLHELARGISFEIVAHTYVRYLGDLYGGQVLCRIVRECFTLQGEGGTRFYGFDAPVEQLRAGFRSELANLRVGASVDAIVAEARWAFELHRELFEQLQSPHRSRVSA